jgi:hypothetical protein
MSWRAIVLSGEHYEGGHWLGTFAVCLSGAAGLP